VKRILLFALALQLPALGLFAQDPKPAEPPKLDPAAVKTKASYAIGHNIGSEFKENGFELDVDELVTGLKEALAGKESKLKPAELQQVMTAFRESIQAQQKVKAEAAAQKNKAAGEKFLAENAKKEGVKVTESGLQYKVVKEGTGASPKATDKVNVHYHGTLLDGTVFDSSVQREEPVSFPLNQVIKGWTEGLQLMKVGGKTTFYIPSDLAYGESERGPGGPHSTLVFEVELLDIEK
jgi:FKBP-type peptidyl-prolyl cis-trans isomerase